MSCVCICSIWHPCPQAPSPHFQCQVPASSLPTPPGVHPGADSATSQLQIGHPAIPDSFCWVLSSTPSSAHLIFHPGPPLRDVTTIHPATPVRDQGQPLLFSPVHLILPVLRPPYVSPPIPLPCLPPLIQVPPKYPPGHLPKSRSELCHLLPQPQEGLQGGREGDLKTC